MRDDGEPISRGQLDRKAAERRALANALFAVGLFAGVVLVNGLLAILFIELMQAVGWWGSSESESAERAATEWSGKLRARLAIAEH
jgi:hypothetical protein